MPHVSITRRAEPVTARSRRFGFGFDRFSGLYLWAGFIIVFGIWKSDSFLSMDTVHSVASEKAVVALLGLAVVVPLAAGVFDLSIGSTANLSAVTVAILQSQHHWGMWPSIIVAILVGMAVGVVNGIVIVRLHVNAFIATLGMATIVGAFQTIVTDNRQPLPPVSTSWSQLTQREIFGFQSVVLYVIVIALIVWWFLECTPAGRYIYAAGGNNTAARLSGVRVDAWTFASLVFSGSIAGVAGVFYSSLNGPSLTFGTAVLLPAYAAAFLGSTQLRPGRFNVWGTIIAVYVLATGVRGVQLVTSVQWLNDMFNGVALIAAVSFAVWRQRRKKAAVDAGPSDAEPEPPPVPTTTDPDGAVRDFADAAPSTRTAEG
jgi:ribose transport system permease protein